MSLSQSMRQVCNIRRPVIESGRRNSREPVYPEGADALHLTDQMCRIKVTQGRVFNDEDRTGQRISFYAAFFPAGTDIKKNDRIEDLKERDGTPVLSLAFIDEILPRRGVAQRHIKVNLREVS